MAFAVKVGSTGLVTLSGSLAFGGFIPGGASNIQGYINKLDDVTRFKKRDIYNKPQKLPQSLKLDWPDWVKLSNVLPALVKMYQDCLNHIQFPCFPG